MEKITLENISKNLPYSTPKDYFDNLPMQIQARVNESDEKLFSISWSRKRSVLAVAASVVLGVLVWITYPEKQGSIGQDDLSKVSNEEILAYIQQGRIKNRDIEESFATLATEESVVEDLDISEEDILEELNNNNIAEEDI